MSNCAAHEILVWGVRDGKRHAQPGKALAATHWHDWTCYLGFPVQGIWPPGSNPTDVNAVHMTSDRALLLCAGDAGGLQLFNAPCVVEGAPYVVGTGHCTAITCCRFLLGDRTAVSTGGGDRSVMVWRLVSAAGGERERFEGGARGGRGWRCCAAQYAPSHLHAQQPANWLISQFRLPQPTTVSKTKSNLPATLYYYFYCRNWIK